MVMNKSSDQSIRDLSILLKLLMSKGMREHLSESMEDLIRLYRICEEKAGLPIEDVKAFLKRITRKDLKFVENPRKFVGGRYPIAFGNKQKSEFIGIMDSLRGAIEGGEIVPFYLGFSSFDPKVANYIQGVIRSLGHVDDYEKIRAKVSASESVEKPTKGSNGDSKNIAKDLEIFSVPYRLIKVLPVSSLGNRFFRQKDTFDNTIKNEILTINFDGWVTFIQIVESLLVNYQLVFGNFERLKLCQHCKKLCFEKKKGAKVFCSDRCRVDDAQESEPGERFNCRNRQNRWIDFRIIRKIRPELKRLHQKNKDIPIFLKPLHVFKYQCGKCPICVAGGKCPTLEKNNAQAFRIIKILSGSGQI